MGSGRAATARRACPTFSTPGTRTSTVVSPGAPRGTTTFSSLAGRRRDQRTRAPDAHVVGDRPDHEPAAGHRHQVSGGRARRRDGEHEGKAAKDEGGRVRRVRTRGHAHRELGPRRALEGRHRDLEGRRRGVEHGRDRGAELHRWPPRSTPLPPARPRRPAWRPRARCHGCAGPRRRPPSPAWTRARPRPRRRARACRGPTPPASPGSRPAGASARPATTRPGLSPKRTRFACGESPKCAPVIVTLCPRPTRAGVIASIDGVRARITKRRGGHGHEQGGDAAGDERDRR